MLITNSVLLADAGVWYAFANSDAMGKGIVVLLFLSSMIAWFIMLERGLSLFRAKKLSERFANAFNNQHGMNSVLREGMDNPCPVARVYISGMEQLLEFYGQTAEEVRNSVPAANNRGPRKLSTAQLDAVQTAMEREISGQIFVIEERIGMLATAVSLAPFLGLFGTVWGVMIAFCGVASAGSANIQALAPGVAGALLTTVAGLIVAIPSLVGYNYLTYMIRKITVSMDNFSESFMARLKLEQLAVKEAEEKKPASPAGAPTAATAASNPAFNRPAAQIPANVPQNPAPAANNSFSRPASYNYQQQPIQYQQPVQPQNPAPAQYQQPVQPQNPAPAQYQQPVQPQNPAPAQYQQPVQPQNPAPAQYQAPQQMSFNTMNDNNNEPENSMRV